LRRIMVIISVALLLMLSMVPAYGADILYRLTHNDQDALILGKIQSRTGEMLRIDIKQVISGKLEDRSVLLKAEFDYNLLSIKPQVGDLCVASLKREPSGYRLQWGIYKVALLEPQLKFEKSGLSDGLKADLTALEWYINSNGKATDFYFDGSDGGVKAYLRQPNGKTVLIYPEQKPDHPAESAVKTGTDRKN